MKNFNIELRLYKRFDADLLALQCAGIPVKTLMVNAVTSYANGQPYKIYIPETRLHDLNGSQKYHVKCTFKDEKAVALLKSIKYGFRNAFCKTILRDALMHQNLGVFFADDNYLALENERIQTQTHENCVICDFDGKNKKVLLQKNILKAELKSELPNIASTTTAASVTATAVDTATTTPQLKMPEIPPVEVVKETTTVPQEKATVSAFVPTSKPDAGQTVAATEENIEETLDEEKQDALMKMFEEMM